MVGKIEKKVIVLKNLYSDIFEEVIFVLKPSQSNMKSNKNLVSEARWIVDNYINKNQLNNDNGGKVELVGFERGRKLNIILNVSLFLSLILFGLLLMKVF